MPNSACPPKVTVCQCKNIINNTIFVILTGLPVMLPDTTESVLLGAAILASVASGDYKSVPVRTTTVFIVGGDNKGSCFTVIL